MNPKIKNSLEVFIQNTIVFISCSDKIKTTDIFLKKKPSKFMELTKLYGINEAIKNILNELETNEDLVSSFNDLNDWNSLGNEDRIDLIDLLFYKFNDFVGLYAIGNLHCDIQDELKDLFEKLLLEQIFGER